jgi:hypothetical protein
MMAQSGWLKPAIGGSAVDTAFKWTAFHRSKTFNSSSGRVVFIASSCGWCGARRNGRTSSPKSVTSSGTLPWAMTGNASELYQRVVDD